MLSGKGALLPMIPGCLNLRVGFGFFCSFFTEIMKKVKINSKKNKTKQKTLSPVVDICMYVTPRLHNMINAHKGEASANPSLLVFVLAAGYGCCGFTTQAEDGK